MKMMISFVFSVSVLAMPAGILFAIWTSEVLGFGWQVTLSGLTVAAYTLFISRVYTNHSKKNDFWK